jgi:hypothetical protein
MLGVIAAVSTAANLIAASIPPQSGLRPATAD